MELKDASRLALEIRDKYEQLENKKYGRSWAKQELALGFIGDVGDLCKLVMADAGIRDIPDHKSKLGHELADCLWSLLVLADKCEIDLVASFGKTMKELNEHIDSRLAD